MNPPQPTNFLGRGWSFPPAFDINAGTVLMLEQEADIRSSLEILLATSLGERVMLPGYGCNLESLLFESLNTTAKTIIADKIRTAILYHEPRIDAEKITINTVQELEGIILIEVAYRVRSTNSRFNFVFPFYREEGTDINLVTTLNALP
ncbi:GPW/gp25 family protein [Haliscomenobacter hydrossis]|uniref:GPW/gp25 family protein n=1 Tax=Haliscomenobacter hydrossis (strain ATCC 27775 / DSM 1100 / LMG 10767 / O) TaxID=760192 RepID=F4L0G9_HALH1|nr:GPW/gp25 family protein [Haliscomenobacter hydrossis]AEE48481.1 GPW/gp25 family protein [Haliscomenobacter hydrossis DSM 1100]